LPVRDAVRPSLRAGDEQAKELFASYLDADSFAGVPRTRLEGVVERGVGTLASVQRMLRGHEGVGELNIRSVECVHRIGLLDLRLLNLDRNEDNILVPQTAPAQARDRVYMRPIDHSLTLPSVFDLSGVSVANWVWRGFLPEASLPFSDLSLLYLLQLNPFDHVARLVKHRADAGSVLGYVVATLALQVFASRGLTLAQAADLMGREFDLGGGAAPPPPSALERVIEAARVKAQREIGADPAYAHAHTLARAHGVNAHAHAHMHVHTHAHGYGGVGGGAGASGAASMGAGVCDDACAVRGDFTVTGTYGPAEIDAEPGSEIRAARSRDWINGQMHALAALMRQRETFERWLGAFLRGVLEQSLRVADEVVAQQRKHGQ